MASYEPRGSSIRAVVRLPGGGKKTATFDTRAEAEAWAAQIEKLLSQEASTGVALVPKAGEKRNNRRLFDIYLDTVASKQDAKSTPVTLRALCRDPIADLMTAATTTHDINAWVTRNLTTVRAKKGAPPSPGTVSRELTVLSAAFTYAVKSLKWLNVNPCHGAIAVPQNRPRARELLSPEELQRIVAASGCDRRLDTNRARTGMAFLLALETGMRVGEILRLRPKDYFRAEQYLYVAALEKGGRKGSKAGARADASRKVPLTKRATEILDKLVESMPADQAPDIEGGMRMPPYIVGISDQQRSAAWQEIAQIAAVEDLHFHDSKHEAATRLSKFIDVIALSHAIGTKNIKLLRDTYYNNDPTRIAKLLPDQLGVNPGQ